ncbi:MAG: hypothetical protein MZW92_56635, partial [Comamonadaceae bacterium]|nr:hypothetical protein [Comamonadaceae bacterium]
VLRSVTCYWVNTKTPATFFSTSRARQRLGDRGEALARELDALDRVRERRRRRVPGAPDGGPAARARCARPGADSRPMPQRLSSAPGETCSTGAPRLDERRNQPGRRRRLRPAGRRARRTGHRGRRRGDRRPARSTPRCRQSLRPSAQALILAQSRPAARADAGATASTAIGRPLRRRPRRAATGPLGATTSSRSPPTSPTSARAGRRLGARAAGAGALRRRRCSG